MRWTRAQDDGWGPQQGLIRHGPWICSTSSAPLITDRSSEMGLCICPNKQKPLPSQNPPLLRNTATNHHHHPPSSSTLPLRLALTRKQTAERQKRNDREGMQLRARWSDKGRKRAGHGLEKTARQKEGESKVSIRGAWSLWTMAARFKAPKRSPPRQWQIRQIRDDPWKPIGVLTAGERPWPRPAGCITVGKRSCQGQTGPQLSAMPPHWRHTARAGACPPPAWLPSSHRTLHSSTETFPGPSIAQLHFGVYISWQVLKLTYLSNSLTYWQCVKECRGALSEGFLTGKA